MLLNAQIIPLIIISKLLENQFMPLIIHIKDDIFIFNFKVFRCAWEWGQFFFTSHWFVLVGGQSVFEKEWCCERWKRVNVSKDFVSFYWHIGNTKELIPFTCTSKIVVNPFWKLKLHLSNTTFFIFLSLVKWNENVKVC